MKQNKRQTNSSQDAAKTIALLIATPHQWGEGKTHILREDKNTLCGLTLDTCPGTITKGYSSQVTCKKCTKRNTIKKEYNDPFYIYRGAPSGNHECIVKGCESLSFIGKVDVDDDAHDSGGTRILIPIRCTMGHEWIIEIDSGCGDIWINWYYVRDGEPDESGEAYTSEEYFRSFDICKEKQ